MKTMLVTVLTLASYSVAYAHDGHGITAPHAHPDLLVAGLAVVTGVLAYAIQRASK